MDLRRKLGLYKESNTNKAEKTVSSGLDIDALISGAVSTGETGPFYLIEKRYPCSHFHGGSCLGEAMNISRESISRLCSENLSSYPEINDLLFLDTETTGLSGGAGTVAFLIGIGFFEEDAFVLRQFFMRDYDEEPAVLTALNEVLARYSGLVTFNGRSFDWNLMQGRFIANRIRPAMKSPIHVDLLYPSRRIWGLKLESCRLSSLEVNILGEERTDDIPGAMIPEVYFKYLQDRNATEIVKVVKHNQLDILSMVSLLVRMTTMLENPLAEVYCEHEIMGMGRIFEKCGEHENVIECFEYCARSTESYPVKSLAAKRLSGIYKRNGEYSKALELWESMLTNSGGFSLFPMIEMAMYYEHKDKNIEKALNIIEKAITISRQTGLEGGGWFPELVKRHERLKRKAQKNIRVDI